MAISYLMDFREFKLLALSCGISRIPEWLKEVSLADQKEIWSSLQKKSYVVFVDGDDVVVDRTINYMFQQASKAESIESAQKSVAYCAQNLCLEVRLDERAKERVRVTPYRDKNEWLSALAEESEVSEDDK